MIDVTGIKLEQLIHDAFELSDHHELFVKNGCTHQGKLPDDYVKQLAEQHLEHPDIALDLQLVQGKNVHLKVHRVVDPNDPDNRLKDRLHIEGWHSKEKLTELLRRHGRIAP